MNHSHIFISTLAQELAEFLRTNEHHKVQALLPRLQAILGGDCAPARDDDPALHYDDAAELTLLLERL